MKHLTRTVVAVASLAAVAATSSCSTQPREGIELNEAPKSSAMATAPATAGASATSTGPAPKVIEATTNRAAFHAPSGNIACFMMTDGIRCDIAQFNYSVPNEAKQSCADDIGMSFGLTPGKPAELNCVTDTVLGSGKVGSDEASWSNNGQYGQVNGSAVLPYDSSLKLGANTCTSTRNYIQCVDSSGNGFSVARAKFTLTPR